MRNFLLFGAILCAVLLSACIKKETNCCAGPPYLAGTWKLSETQVSNGSVGGFVPYKGPLRYVIFYADGRLTTRPDIMGFDYNWYQIQSANEILFVRAYNRDSVKNFYELTSNTLTIHYRGIEPNGVRFKRISR